MSDEQPTTTWWRVRRATFRTARRLLETVQVVRDTDKTLLIQETPGGRTYRANKQSTWELYFRTKEGAVQYLLDLYRRDIARYESRVADYKNVVAYLEEQSNEAVSP